MWAANGPYRGERSERKKVVPAMSVWKMVIREMAYRKLSLALALGGVSAAVASLVGALTLLRFHDAQTESILVARRAETKAIMDGLREDVKKAMHRLGYNAIILPENQPLGDWYADDYASLSLPDDTVSKLSRTQGLCERLLPRLRQKVEWREKKWTVIVVGVGKEHILEATVSEQHSLVQDISPGTCVLGYELHHALDLKPGDQITILGRPCAVVRCEPETGTKDDITIWMHLADAQDLLGKPGVVNEVLIVEHLSVWGNVKEVRRKVRAAVPGCQVVEMASETMTRAHARIKVAEEAEASLLRERDKRKMLKAEMARNVLIFVPMSLLVCSIWIGFLMYLNVRDRILEMGTLSALGYRSRLLQALVLVKAGVIGLLGTLLGFVLGTGGVMVLKGAQSAVVPWSGRAVVGHLGAALAVAITICLVGSWLPARALSRLDPAEVLRGE